jgi:protein O-mannosyl-transferase
MAAKNKTNLKAAPAAKPAATPARAAAAGKPTPEKTNLFPSGFWRTHWLPALILLALSFGLYNASIWFGYVLDDQMVIWDNAYVQKGFAGLREIFAYDSFMGYFKEQKFLLEGGRYRPLSLATFAVEVGVFGKNNPHLAHYGHFINILLYGLNGVVLYRLLAGLFPQAEGGRWYFGTAFIAAVLFVLHPLHVECVANIKGRDEILALMGSLGAVWAAFRYFDTGRAFWLAVMAVLLLLGMLAKENALTFVAVIPLTVWFFGKLPAHRVAALVPPLALSALAFILIRYSALGYMLNHGKSMTDIMNNPFLFMNAGEKIATIFLTLGWYVKLLFVPNPLTHDYYPYHVPKVGLGDWKALLSIAFYLGMSVWAVMNLRRRSVPAYAVLFWLLTVSIVSNIFVAVGTFMNERFVYMPSVAFCLMGGWFVAQKLPELFKKVTFLSKTPLLPGAVLFGVVALLFGLRSFTRVPDWKDALSLNSAAIKVSGNSARSHCFYVTALYREVFPKRKPEQRAAMLDTLEYHIRRSLEIYPKYSSALIMKGALAGERYGIDKNIDRMLADFESILMLIPYENKFRTYLFDYLDYFKNRLDVRPQVLNFCYKTGYEFFFKQKRDAKSALLLLDKGLQIQPGDARLSIARAEVLQGVGNTKAVPGR